MIDADVNQCKNGTCDVSFNNHGGHSTKIVVTKMNYVNPIFQYVYNNWLYQLLTNEAVPFCNYFSYYWIISP